MKTYKVGILGGTGTVGQILLSRLFSHPFFRVKVLAASPKSAGKTLYERTGKHSPFDDYPLYDIERDKERIKENCDFVFSTFSADFERGQELEEEYAKMELPVISCNPYHRRTPDVPMVIPELNHAHLSVLPFQKKRLQTKRGFIATKCNCAIQSFVVPLYFLQSFGIQKVAVCTYQSLSGMGELRNPDLVEGNILPYIEGEEEKCQFEPLKIFGKVKNGVIVPSKKPLISATCVRVPVERGHMASVRVQFRKKPSLYEIKTAWAKSPYYGILPSAPQSLIHYFRDYLHPQPRFDLNEDMSVYVGRLKEDTLFDYSFMGLSDNLVKGAGGGAIMLAELLALKGCLE